MKFSKKMCFSSLVIAGLAIAGAAGAIALTHNSDAFFTKATNNDPSFSISANEFANGDGYVEKWGVKFNYTKATVAGGLVTLNQMYTNYAEGSYSGSTKSESGTRGDGFVSLSFTDFSLGDGAGEVVYVFDSSHGHLTGLGLSASVDLTNNGAISSHNRTGFEIVSNNRMITFSKLTITYSCADVSPEINLKKDSTSVGAGDNTEVEAETFDVFGSDTVTYAWSSDDTSVATASGSGLTGTITGVAAGTANITVTMTVNGVNYSDSLVVTVTETAATVKDLEVLKTSSIQGAGIFCRFNPSSQGVTAANLDSFGLDKISLNFATATENAINHYVLQEKGDSSYTAYVVCDSAVGLNNAFNIVCDFKDTTNNIIYRATAHFNGGALEFDLNLDVSKENLLVDETATITATKGSYLEGEPTFTFVSSDTSVLSVVTNGNVATVTAEGEGNANITTTMTLGGKNYVKEQSFIVSSDILYLGWDKTEGGPLYIQGAGMVIAVDCTTAGYSSNDDANSALASINLKITNKNVTGIVNFQKPGFASANGLYVTLSDADFSTITKIELSIPHKTSGKIYTAVAEVSFSGSTPTIATLNGVDYDTYIHS